MSGRAVRWLWSLVRPSVRAAEARLTIVRHHRVYRDGERPLYRLGVGESVLREQVAMLRSSGLGPLTVLEGLERLAAGAPGHWVAMTFDDGYADNVTRALPILRAGGARATFYLTAGLIEERRAPWWDRVAHALERARSPELEWPCGGERLRLSVADPGARRRALATVLGRLRVAPAEQEARIAALEDALGIENETPCELATWDQAAELVAAGMEVGAHTLGHPFLACLPAEHQAREIAGSVRSIDRRLGVRVEGLAYPGGSFDEHSVRLSREAGLRYSVTTQAGDNAPDTPAYELRRRGFDEGMCLSPLGGFSRRLARAELEGAFDGLRAARREAVA
jgi:peptidoglycan/xylan/chitin deacetylase (PgdA/CDA1 family)